VDSATLTCIACGSTALELPDDTAWSQTYDVTCDDCGAHMTLCPALGELELCGSPGVDVDNAITVLWLTLGHDLPPRHRQILRDAITIVDRAHSNGRA
jgi:hypothetical protein